MGSIEKSCCFTGHRIIAAEQRAEIMKKTYEICKKLAMSGYENFITGGALGFDTIAAKCVTSLKKDFENIRLVLALPCENQAKGWKETDVREYNKIIDSADEVIYVSKEYYQGCMRKRNRFMVDESRVCVAYLKRTAGGTAYTVSYAVEQNREVIFVK